MLIANVPKGLQYMHHICYKHGIFNSVGNDDVSRSSLSWFCCLQKEIGFCRIINLLPLLIHFLKKNKCTYELSGKEKLKVTTTVAIKASLLFRSGLFSDPADCQCFYNCANNVAFHTCCAEDTLWDEVTINSVERWQGIHDVPVDHHQSNSTQSINHVTLIIKGTKWSRISYKKRIFVRFFFNV